MFAVIKAGGRQIKVSANDVVEVDRLAAEAGDKVTFAEVLMLGGEDGVTVGAPTVEGASVAGEVIEQTRAAKVIAFKKRRRKNSRRARGHRQHLTMVRITAIEAAGAAPKPKKARAAKAAPAAPEAPEAAASA